jgi:hypothetical protein
LRVNFGFLGQAIVVALTDEINHQNALKLKKAKPSQENKEKARSFSRVSFFFF